jgi:prepilin-type N-terminal cleavage/methylation domain-containing protein
MNNKGFTLIELLVVVAIIGILAAIGTSRFYIHKESAYNSMARTDLRNAITAQEANYASTRSYQTCANAIACEAALAGFSASKDDEGNSVMSTFLMNDDTESFTAQAAHSSGSSNYTYDSSLGIIEED